MIKIVGSLILIEVVRVKGRDCDSKLLNSTILVNKTLYTFSHLVPVEPSGDAAISGLRVATSEMWRWVAATRGVPSRSTSQWVQGSPGRPGWAFMPATS
jgi:hypothetical protein